MRTRIYGSRKPLKSQFAKELFHLRLYRGIHLDERRPGAFEDFARQFLCRINAEFAAAGDFAGRVVEHVGRAFGEEAVALRIGVGSARASRASVSALADRIRRRAKKVSTRASKPTPEAGVLPIPIC